jgi:phosphatidylserine/phosphatidylglycerophosphate/cardiolipin synthase-like enzyme
MSAEAKREATLAAPRPHPATDRVEWLIDNADAYRELVRMIRGARHTLWLSQLALDADCVAYDIDAPSHSAGGGHVTLAHELLGAARRGVRVCVLLNASLLLNTAKPLRRWLADAHGMKPSFRIRGIARFPQLLHAKLLIADGTSALLVGSPFANGYWDDAHHVPANARRPHRELGGRPVHDVSSVITGPAVHALSAAFVELWNHAEDPQSDFVDPIQSPATTPGPSSARELDARASLRVVRTAPRRSTPGRPDGRVEILPALLDGIARAQSLIYIEHQYLSARPVVAALVAALARTPRLEIVVVLNQNPDVTAYRRWQHERLRKAGLLDHPRMGVFALWSAAREDGTGALRLNQVFVHSKIVAIDDRWAMVGSANLDGVSLHSYGDDFVGPIGRRLFRDVRNFDVDVVLESLHEDDHVGHALLELRRRLWREHLGADVMITSQPPAGGWLALWRDRADSARLELATPGTVLTRPTFALPFSSSATPRGQLAGHAVQLAPSHATLCFTPSWVEVHLGLGWVRNMFA